MTHPTNEQRAHWAALAIEAFATTTGMADEDLSICLKDLMTDLQHLADVYGIDWESALEDAKQQYLEELTDEPTTEEACA